MKYVLATLGILFTGSIFWALSVKPMGESFSVIVADPWGVVTLADLYLGFIIFSVFIFATSKSKLHATLWTLSVLTLGNVMSVIYLIMYLSKTKYTKRVEL